MFGILLHAVAKMVHIIGDSVITCDEIIDAEANWFDKETKFNEKKALCKTLNIYIILAFLLNTIALLIAVSIFCYLVKYEVKQKYILIN